MALRAELSLDLIRDPGRAIAHPVNPRGGTHSGGDGQALEVLAGGRNIPQRDRHRRFDDIRAAHQRQPRLLPAQDAAFTLVVCAGYVRGSELNDRDHAAIGFGNQCQRHDACRGARFDGLVRQGTGMPISHGRRRTLRHSDAVVFFQFLADTSKRNIRPKVSDHPLQGSRVAATPHARHARKGAEQCAVVFVSIDLLNDCYVTEGAVPAQFFLPDGQRHLLGRPLPPHPRRSVAPTFAAIPGQRPANPRWRVLRPHPPYE